MYGSPLVSVYSGAMIGRRPGGWSCCCELVDRERGTWLRKGLFGRSGSAGVSPELVAFLRMLSQNFIEVFKFLHVFSFVCLAYDQLRPGILSFCNSLLLLRFTGYVVFLVQFCFWQRIRSCFVAPCMVFLDKLCIHQTQPDLKQEGIAGLGAFVKSSDKLVVLWSSRYFTRLCLSERDPQECFL